MLRRSPPRSIEFTVPDRSDPADGTPETIRYSWSGDAGDPLLRRYNGSNPAVVADDVHHLDLSMVTRSVIGATPATPMPDPASWGNDFVTCPDERVTDEMLLIYHDDAPGGSLLEEYVGRHAGDDRLAAQGFLPTLPANTTSWAVTHVVLRLRRSGRGVADRGTTPAARRRQQSGRHRGGPLCPGVAAR